MPKSIPQKSNFKKRGDLCNLSKNLKHLIDLFPKKRVLGYSGYSVDTGDPRECPLL